jgi:hypothetical protein
VTLLSAVMLMMVATAASAANGNPAKWDKDGNGIPDVGVVVTGNETSVVDIGGGVTCKLRMNYRGTFDNDPYMDSGWIQNHYQCSDGTAYNYLFVHETDPRYTGNPDLAIWNTWEWHILTASGYGNIANPNHPHYAFPLP